MGSSYCEKYKPLKVEDVIGDEQATDEIIRLLKNFPIGKHKCILVTGTHGSGKTCRVDMILKKLNYIIKPLNISKIKRSDKLGTIQSEKTKKKQLELYIKELTSCSNVISLFNGEENYKCAIVVDELDTESLSLEKNQLIDLMKLNNEIGMCPIIFIFDTKHNRLINTLRKGSHEVIISEPSNEDMMELLKRICFKEKLRIKNKEVAQKIIDFSQHDFRRLCMTLNDIVNDVGNNVITLEIVNNYAELMLEKDVSTDLFRSTYSLLSTYNNIDECQRLYEVEKVNIPLMVHQNYLLATNCNNEKSFDGIMKITNALSYGDVIDNYIYGEQRWDITNVHGFYSCCMPSYLLKHNNHNVNFRPKFPVDMNKTSIKKLNKKHITNASRTFNSVDPIDYVYMGKIINALIKDDAQDKIIEIMKTYKLSLEKVESILKIDKHSQYKLSLTNKQKKILKEV